MLKVLDFHDNSFVGVLARTNEKHTFVGPTLPKRMRLDIEEALGTEVVPLTVGGATIVGSLVALNGRGALVADIATEAELDVLRGVGLKVERLAHALNAAGNNVLVNDKGALLHPEYDPSTSKLIAELFGVEAKRGTVAESSTVGMAAVATGAGLLVHPKASEAQRGTLESLFGVESQAATINHGVPSVGAGVVANSKGALVGTASTGLELGRVEDALRLF